MTNQLSNTEIMNKYVEVAELDRSNIEIFVANKHFKTFEQFINSPELKEVHSGFQSSTSITESMFSQAWVVGKDVHVQYKIDGINFIKKESIISMLSNSGLYNVIPFNHIGFIIKKDECYDKGESNIRIFRQRDWMVLVSA